MLNEITIRSILQCYQCHSLKGLKDGTLTSWVLLAKPEGYEHILLCIDSSTRWSEAFPLKTQSAKETANVLYKELFTRYGAPKVLFSDRGRNFMSNLVNALCEIFDVTQHHTSAYHPSTNGMVERQNSTLAQSLRTYCGKEQTKWPELLPSIMMAFRKSPSMHSTEFSPYYLAFGTEMRLPFDVSLEPANHLGRDAKTFIEHKMQETIRTSGMGMW